jgi:hypothetical protein
MPAEVRGLLIYFATGIIANGSASPNRMRDMRRDNDLRYAVVRRLRRETR